MEDHQIVLLVGSLNGKMDTVIDTIDVINKRLNNLPCATHSEQLHSLTDWKKTCNGVKQAEQIESYKGNISLRNNVLLNILTFFTGVIGTIITLWATNVIGG